MSLKQATCSTEMCRMSLESMQICHTCRFSFFSINDAGWLSRTHVARERQASTSSHDKLGVIFIHNDMCNQVAFANRLSLYPCNEIKSQNLQLYSSIHMTATVQTIIHCDN